MFSVLFAIGRLPGWIAHWHEQNSDSNMRIARPHQIHIGNGATEYVPMEDCIWLQTRENRVIRAQSIHILEKHLLRPLINKSATVSVITNPGNAPADDRHGRRTLV